MNKTYLIMFGAILLIGLVSAAVVTYYSNTAVVDISVDQPLKLQVSVGSGWVDGPATMASGFGGETDSYYVKVENRASATIPGKITEVISNGGTATCADFTLITTDACTDTSCAATVGAPVAWDSCTISGTGDITVTFPATSFVASTTSAFKEDITWNAGIVPATYSINTTATV